VKGSILLGMIVSIPTMINFVFGIIFGIIASTIGFGSIAKILDGVMFNIQKTTVELNRPQLPEPTNYIR